MIEIEFLSCLIQIISKINNRSMTLTEKMRKCNITKKEEIIDKNNKPKFFLCNIELEISIWNTRSHNFIFGNCSSLCFWISFVALSVYLVQLQSIWRERAAAFSLGFKRYRRFTYIVVLAHINPYLYMADAKFK